MGTILLYELIYVWGTESDETIRRVVFEDNKLYMCAINLFVNFFELLFDILKSLLCGHLQT